MDLLWTDLSGSNSGSGGEIQVINLDAVILAVKLNIRATEDTTISDISYYTSNINWETAIVSTEQYQEFIQMDQ
jgi:hypothetical protein